MSAAPVLMSAGGSRFHVTQWCPALIAGQSANGDGSHYAGTNVPVGTYPPVATTIAGAMGAGKLPCLVCLPELHASWFRTSSEDDFGHEPFGPYDEVLICRRCYVIVTREWIDAYDMPCHQKVRDVVIWPCTSAIVLGLVSREEVSA